jgi:hypothetical protein
MPIGMNINNYDTTKLFLSEPSMFPYSYTNSTGSTVTIAKGQLIGKIFATGLVLPTASTATDGSQMPIGICGDSYTVLNGGSATIQVSIKGSVAKSKLVCAAGDTLDTTVMTQGVGGTLGDMLVRNSGIVYYAGDELTAFDNQ